MEAVMQKTHLIIVIHNHMSIDQDNSVFEQAADRCYTPFLETLEQHPGIRLGLHYSGILFEWMEKHRSDLLDKLSALCGRGQIELLGGGFYEPILSALPKPDAVGQIEMLNDYIERRFGIRPQGVWLAEQVWEPEMIELLAGSQFRYTLLDDSQLIRAGLTPSNLDGYYVTDKGLQPLAVFPMDRKLRRFIPQNSVTEVIEKLSELAASKPQSIVWGDNGHKLGLWPESYEKIFEAKWLEDFFKTLEQSDRFECSSPLAYLNRFSPTGKIYIPSCCNEEMLRSCMPTEFFQRIESIEQKLKLADFDEDTMTLLGNGNWQSCLSKYPEAEHLYKKMLLVSSKIADAANEANVRSDYLDQARSALYRSQSHDAYWPGPEGGLQLPLLRDAVYKLLIQAETLLDAITQSDENDWISYDERDFDSDLSEEVIVENAWLNVIIDPAKGGVITEIDYKPAALNPTNVLTRKIECWHRFKEKSSRPPEQDIFTKPDNDSSYPELKFQEKAVADLQPRRCLMDRFPASGTSLEEFQQSSYHEEGDFLQSRYHIEMTSIDENDNCDFKIMMSRIGNITREHDTIPLIIEKQIKISADKAYILATYQLRNPEANPADLIFCPELNLSLHSEDNNRCIFELDRGLALGPSLQAPGKTEEAACLTLADLNQHFRIWLQWDPPTSVWRYPVESISRTSMGIRSIFQGVAIIPKWEVTIPPKQSITVKIAMEFHSAEEDDDAVVPLSDSSKPTNI